MTFNPAAFWAENALCQNKPFRTDKPRCPVWLPLDDHWLLEEMQLPSTLRYYQDPAYRAATNRACNDRLEPAIGLRFFNESVEGPALLRIEEVFGSRLELTENATPWLEPSVHSPDDLRRLLDRVESLSDPDFRALLLSKGAILTPESLNPDGSRKTRTPWSRGPSTIATSVLGTTECLYYLVDEPALMARFYDSLTRTLIRYHRTIADLTNTVTRGFCWLDDNCALLSPELYAQFCLPLMKTVFDTFCPNPADYRFQHSDSAMEHIIPLLATLNFHGVNFGPTILASTIRQHMPRTIIHGQIAPMTLRNAPMEAVREEIRRDFAAAGPAGALLLTTSGSVSAGTTIPRLRDFLEASAELTRY